MSRKENYDKALALLQSPDARYDTDHALVLCQLHHFIPGVLFIYEKAKLYGGYRYISFKQIGNIYTYQEQRGNSFFFSLT